jgi:hypothetical protein
MDNDQGVVQMIYNENLHRLTDAQIVKDFMRRQRFKVAPSDNDFGLILFRLPYVIEFKDALIENYLEVYFSDLEGLLYMEGSSALGCSLDLKLQNIEDLRARDLTHDQNKEFFLSECDLKIRHLYSNLEAIDKLLPLIEAKRGLVSMRDGTFDPRPDFKDSVKPMWHGMKERYLRCIAQADESK